MVWCVVAMAREICFVECRRGGSRREVADLGDEGQGLARWSATERGGERCRFVAEVGRRERSVAGVVGEEWSAGRRADAWQRPLDGAGRWTMIRIFAAAHWIGQHTSSLHYSEMVSLI